MQRETKAFSRRDFMKTSATATAAAASSAALFNALGTNFAHAQGSDLIKVGVVGCGGRGSGAAGNVLEGAQIAGAKAEIYSVGDVFEGSAKGLAGKHNVQRERVFAGLDNYKEVIGSGVDMVILATPPGFRPRHFKAAI